MDESLKARLIGAAVLVAIAVLLIPEMLSGRKSAEPQSADPAAERGTRTFTIELNGGGGPPVAVTEPAPQAATAAAPRPASEVPVAESQPSPSAPGPAPPEAEPEPVAAAEAPGTVATTATKPPALAPTPAEPPPASPAPPAARGGWVVQVGAFGSAEAARRLVEDLEGAGYRAFVSPVKRSGKTLHRVRVGPEPSRDEASRLAARLKGRGLPAAVVAND